MTHNQYWAQRNKNLNDAILDEAYKDVANLEKQYDIAVKEIDDQIRAWYQRIANANGVSFAEAKKLLTSGELEGFKWTVEEYIARASEVSDKWANALENASARVHISRLESLKVQLQQHVEELTGKRLEVTQNAVEHAYTESYYHTAYELQKEVGLGVNMAQIDKKHLEKVLSRPWTADGSTFSDIIWKDNARLVDTINKELTRMIATGAAPDNAIKNISKAFNTSKSNAGRVVMTESAYFSSAAHKECFEDLDVEEYEIVGTFDKNMCSECGTLDGEHAPMSEYKEGITAPPFHPWCRCTTVPYFEDMKGIGERWMRNPETGKGDYVPSDMTYEEWKSIYVDKTSTMEEWQAKHGGVQKAVEVRQRGKHDAIWNGRRYGCVV